MPMLDYIGMVNLFFAGKRPESIAKMVGCWGPWPGWPLLDPPLSNAEGVRPTIDTFDSAIRKDFYAWTSSILGVFD